MLLMDYPSIREYYLQDYANQYTRNILNAYIDAHIQMLTDEYTGYVLQAITRMQYQYANMNFDDKIRYNRLIQKLVHK